MRLAPFFLALWLGCSAVSGSAQEAPPTWAVLADDAEQLAEAGELDSATVLLERASSLAEGHAPDTARVHLALLAGSVAAEAGHAQAALEHFERALSLEPSARPSSTTPRVTAAFALALALHTSTPPVPLAAPIDAPREADAPALDPLSDTMEPETSEALTEVSRPPVGALRSSVGVAGDFSWIAGGLPADGARPPGFGEGSPWTSCDARGEQCTVRVDRPGFGTTLAVLVGVFLEPVDRLALGVSIHAQPGAGTGFMAGWLLEVAARGRPLDPHAFPLDLELVIALGLGQIQVRPPQAETSAGPFVASGPGSTAAGAALVARVETGVELVLDLLGRLAFPTVLGSLETSLSLRVAP